MWILESGGDVLNHKRIWLRPGKTYLFGRTKPEQGRYRTGFQINHKTVSRKHLILSVASVEPDQVGIVSHRSEVTFEDAGTKLGTTIDDQKIKGGGKFTSTEGTHVFKLSAYEYSFKLTWKPVVLSYTFSSKEYKNGNDPLMPVRARLTELDVKAIHNYAAGKTTHVIANKRNTARGLQALVEGGRIITDEFVSALEAAATTMDLHESETFAALEQDFDQGWPNETDFLPAPGKEPGPKDAEHYAPAPERKDIFDGFTFIFFDTRQYESLQPPITLGGGKATMCSFEENVTTVQEAHRFVKATAGETDGGELSGDNKVVCVKFGSPKEAEEWSNRFKRDLCLAIGFRMIEQNEFLDAILRKDPAKLFKRLLYEDEADSAEAGPSVGSDGSSVSRQNTAQQQSAAQEPTYMPPRRIHRGKVKSLFKGFDNDFDESAVAPAPPSIHLNETTATGNNVDHGNDMDLDRGRSGSKATQTNGRKRPVPDSEGDSELEQLEANMFKHAAAMKKRRLESKAFDNDEDTSVPTTRATSELVATDELPTKQKKIKKELDIGAAVKAHREAEEAKQKRDSEDEGTTGIDDMTLAQMKTLAVVEEFEPRINRGKQKEQAQICGSLWKPEWNGRKNFKKFRRQGEGTANRRGQTVIVPLEEVKPKDIGYSESVWTTSAPNSRPGRVRRQQDSSDVEDFSLSGESASRSQPSKQSTGANMEEEEEELENNDPEDGADAREIVPNTVPSNLQTGEGTEVIDVDAPRTTRARGPAIQVTATQQSSAQTGRKRAATQSTNGTTAAPKKQRKLDERPRKARGDDDSDEEGFQFRLKKRR